MTLSSKLILLAIACMYFSLTQKLKTLHIGCLHLFVQFSKVYFILKFQPLSKFGIKSKSFLISATFISYQIVIILSMAFFKKSKIFILASLKMLNTMHLIKKLAYLVIQILKSSA